MSKKTLKNSKSYDLTGQDYIRILTRYGQPIPGGKNRFQKAALACKRFLSNKLCNCINDVMKTSKTKNKRQNTESRAIAICTSSIFNKKGLHRSKFTCKKRPRVEFTKRNR